MEIGNCIVCGSPNALNTELSITVDGAKIKVKVCDDHADDLTPKLAKEAYLKRKAEIDEIMEKAKALGLSLAVPASSGKIATVSRPAQQPVERPLDNKPAVAASVLEGDDVIPTSVVDSRMQNVRGVGGSVPGMSGSLEVSKAVSINTLESKLDRSLLEGKAKMALVDGRCGQPVAIPEIRQDGTGTTRITVNQGRGDAAIQQRFKEVASNDIMTPGGFAVNSHGFALDGYDIRDCNLCGGTGMVMRTRTEKMSCPKCKGTGMAN